MLWDAVCRVDIVVIAYVEEHGKGQYPLDVPVMDADGVHCADVHIVFYLMPKP